MFELTCCGDRGGLKGKVTALWNIACFSDLCIISHEKLVDYMKVLSKCTFIIRKLEFTVNISPLGKNEVNYQAVSIIVHDLSGF